MKENKAQGLRSGLEAELMCVPFLSTEIGFILSTEMCFFCSFESRDCSGKALLKNNTL